MRKRPVPIERWMEQQQDLPVGLYWTAAYFKFSALLGVAGLTMATVAVAMDAGLRSRVLAHPAPIVIVPFMIGCSWWAGRLLESRRRQGGWLALGALVPPILQWAVRGGTPGFGVMLSALGVLAVLRSWRELD